MPDRIDARPVLTVVGGALLLISLFMDWYVVPAVPPATADVAIGNAWAVFETLDLVMAAVAIAAIYAAYEQITGRQRLSSGWLLPLGLLALIVVVSQILDAPPSAGDSHELATGAWLALGGAVAMAIGGVLSAAHVSLSLELDSSAKSGSRGAPGQAATGAGFLRVRRTLTSGSTKSARNCPV
jgi:hypothetical protein